MAAQHGNLKINLLPKDSFEFSNLGKTFKWVTTVGRVLVVLTEFVVLLAFGSRFYFDKAVNDQLEEIDGKLATIEGYQEIETQMKGVLAKQKPISNFLGNNLGVQDKFYDLSQVVQSGVNFENLTLQGKEMNLTGLAISERAFAIMIARLKANERIQKVALGETTFDQKDGSLKFNLNVTYK